MASAEAVLALAQQSGLLGLDPKGLAAYKAAGARRLDGDGASIYRRSIRMQGGTLYFTGSAAGEKALYLVSEKPLTSEFDGAHARSGGVSVLRADPSAKNAERLHRVFPFTAPVSLRGRMTTIGCGDRLGLATPGHVRAVAGFDASPVLAQQSIRELTLTRRNFPGVVADVTFLVFQEGFEAGYGADGDHLKTIADIETALAAGMPMITLDLSDVMTAEPASWSAARVDAEFEKLDAEEKSRVLAAYADRTFRVGAHDVHCSALEAKRCALMYLRALDFSVEVDRTIRTRRGSRYDLEISIDETTAPTLPAHHLFIASELARRGVAVSSLAPRFVGEFQKGIDYIGDVGEFETQFAVHCAIAQARGGYKISIHSGSDKFSVYPPIGRHTDMRVHVKTAGTSWLQAVAVIARSNPPLFRRMLARAVSSFPEASRLYHVGADPAAVPDPRDVSDSELPSLVEDRTTRQVLHITYGGLLSAPDIRADLLATLSSNEDLHYAAVEEHIARHLRLLGVKPRS